LKTGRLEKQKVGVAGCMMFKVRKRRIWAAHSAALPLGELPFSAFSELPRRLHFVTLAVRFDLKNGRQLNFFRFYG
jgi:hypothetical protein